MKTFQSWGRLPRVTHQCVIPLFWRCEIPRLDTLPKLVLPYGLGRSYGDVCLNPHGILLSTSRMNRVISFDRDSGMFCCEAGMSLAEVLEIIVPSGWFLPVTPGTKYITVGGAIANDVHGKNHHLVGTFGNFVTRFELLRSDGTRIICSPNENRELFSATIGGLGLTGLITWVEFRLKPIKNPFIEMESIKFYSISEFLTLSEASQNHEYVVAWLDCSKGRNKAGYGILMRGNHALEIPPDLRYHKSKQLTFPIDAPSFLLNRWSIRLFNSLYFNKQLQKTKHQLVHYEPFFYPLDIIRNWNRMYGKRGFYQYQCVVPFDQGMEAIQEILSLITKSGNPSFLVVLKTFGSIESPGMMSFPRPGITLALDFPNKGKPSLQLFNKLDKIVQAARGALYPAKDARMSSEIFILSFPNLEKFKEFVDPQFSSGFWRRVTGMPHSSLTQKVNM